MTVCHCHIRARWEEQTAPVQGGNSIKRVKLIKKLVHYTHSQLNAHRDWVKRGRTGSGRISEEDSQFTTLRAHAAELSGSVFRRCGFEASNFNMTYWKDSSIVDCHFNGCELESCDLDGSTLEACRFERSHMVLAHFLGTRVMRCTFDGSNLARTTWKNAIVSDASFAACNLLHARLSDASFQRCSFRGTRFADATAVGATFVGCDFTDADPGNWVGAAFEGCTSTPRHA